MPSQCENRDVPSVQWIWSQAEKAEKRKNANTARRADLALPQGLTRDAYFSIGYKYAKDIADRYGVVCFVNFHNLESKNPHIDMMWTTRIFDGEKFDAKTRILDDKKTGPEEIRWLREQWASRVNEVLLQYGTHIDHRSYRGQGSMFESPSTYSGRAEKYRKCCSNAVNANNNENIGESLCLCTIITGSLGFTVTI